MDLPESGRVRMGGEQWSGRREAHRRGVAVRGDPTVMELRMDLRVSVWLRGGRRVLSESKRSLV